MNIFKALFGSKAENPEEEKKAAEERDFDVLKYDGIRALKTGNAAYAAECFTHALELQNDLEVRDYLSQALIRTGSLPEALEQLHVLEEAQPDNVAIYLRKADVAYMMENYQLVGESCEKALLYDADNAMALYLYGRALMGMGDDMNAVAMLTQAMEKNDNFGDAMLMRAKAYLGLGDIDSARADAAHLLEKNPDNEDVLLLMADVEKAEGNTQQALDIYNNVVELNPFCGPAFLGRAEMKRKLGDEAGADEDMEAFKQINPEADDEDIAKRVDESRRAIDPFGIG